MLNSAKYFSLFLISISLLLTSCSGGDGDSQDSTVKAREYLEQRQIREAILELKNALKSNPENAEARYLLGTINLKLGDTATAEKEFRRAKRAAWSEEEVQLGTARAWLNGKSYQKVIDDIKVEPTYSLQTQADLHGIKSMAHLSLGQNDNAKKMLDSGYAIDDTSMHLSRAAIVYHLSNNDVEAASKSLEQALNNHPDEADILLLQAKVVMLDNQVDVAKQALNSVIANDGVKLVTVYGRKARLELGNLELQQNNLDLAQKLVAPLIKQNPSDIKAGYLLGLLAFAREDYDLADDRLLAVLKNAPGYTDAQLMYGAVCYAKKDYGQAAYYLEKYNSVIPQNLAARKLLGRTYLMQRQFESAKSILTPGLSIDKNDAELLTLLSLAELESSKGDKGLETLEAAARTAPESKAIQNQLMQAYLTQGESDRAIASLKEEVTQQGNADTDRVSMLLLGYIRESKFDEAFELVGQMLQEKPDDVAVLTQAGNVYAASGDFNKASEYLDKALALQPTYLPAAMSLGNMEEVAGNYDNAMTIYMRVLDGGETSITPMLATARLSGLLGDKNAQLSWLVKAHEQEPNNIEPLLMQAEYYLAQNQLTEAKQRVKDALKITPGYAKSLALLGRVLIAEKQYNEALRPLNELVVKKPQSRQARSLFAEAYFRLGQWADAKQQLRTVLAQDPAYIPALALIVPTAIQLGEYAEAQKYAKSIQQHKAESPLGFDLAGDALMASSKYTQAKEAYLQAWQRQPSSVLAIKLSEVMRLAGQDGSAQYLEEWLAKSPEDIYAIRFLGTAYFTMQKYDESIEQFEKVLQLEPENYVVMNNLAVIHTKIAMAESQQAQKMSALDRAVDYADRAYKLSPTDPGILDTYGWALLQKGQFAESKKLLQKAAELMPENAEINYHYAVSLHKTGEPAKAKQLLRDILNSSIDFDGRDAADNLLQSI